MEASIGGLGVQLLAWAVDDRTLPEHVVLVRLGGPAEGTWAIVTECKEFAVRCPCAAALDVQKVVCNLVVGELWPCAREGACELQVGVVNASEPLFGGLIAYKMVGGGIAYDVGDSMFEMLNG